MMKKVCVLGAGSWGTALALVLASNDYNICLWTLDDAQNDEINIRKVNSKYLPGVRIPVNIKSTLNIEEAIRDSEIIVLGVPSQAIRQVCKRINPYIKNEQIIVNVSKGLESGSNLRMSEVCREELPYNKYVMLSGPSHAEEVAKGIPTTVVVSSQDRDAAKLVQDAFRNSSFRVYFNEDVVGVELGGALKNIIAFGAGICDGLGYGDNTKAALMSRGLREISRLGNAMGAQESTFSGLSGIGDLIVTCTSMHSRNRRAGILIGQGKSMQEALNEVKMVVEGVTATKVAYDLASKLNVDMPIVNAIYSVLYDNVNADSVVKELMLRESVCEMGNPCVNF